MVIVLSRNVDSAGDNCATILLDVTVPFKVHILPAVLVKLGDASVKDKQGRTMHITLSLMSFDSHWEPYVDRFPNLCFSTCSSVL